jgi:para-aminobenzoate synthetase component I
MKEREYKSFKVNSLTNDDFAMQALRWSGLHFGTSVYLNSNSFDHDKYNSLDAVIALGDADSFLGVNDSVFNELKIFSDQVNDWLFGFLAYELKNQSEHLRSKNPDRIEMPLAHFFRPVILMIREHDTWRVGCLPGYGKFSHPGSVISGILEHQEPDSDNCKPVTIKARVSKERYLQQVKAIKEHIQAGDVYEMNYCVEFFAEDVEVNPISVYERLNKASPTPFSGFYATEGKYLMCASPERFMKKQGSRLVSQPIKGTRARGNSPKEDQTLRQGLYHDTKERSENVMIVDLVRNDLSRTARKGSVKVEELFGIYSFKQVHQMISTVVSELHPKSHYLDAIKYAFPMGSMTGAPKIRAMQLIDQYEDTRRGLYSGAIGYISPEKNFDFNVVIRSIQYNKKNKYLSYMAGSAITSGSVPEKEYEECLLKARAMAKALQGL